jgi:hypothetical protein
MAAFYDSRELPSALIPEVVPPSHMFDPLYNPYVNDEIYVALRVEYELFHRWNREYNEAEITARAFIDEDIKNRKRFPIRHDPCIHQMFSERDERPWLLPSSMIAEITINSGSKQVVSITEKLFTIKPGSKQAENMIENLAEKIHNQMRKERLDKTDARYKLDGRRTKHAKRLHQKLLHQTQQEDFPVWHDPFRSQLYVHDTEKQIEDILTFYSDFCVPTPPKKQLPMKREEVEEVTIRIADLFTKTREERSTKQVENVDHRNNPPPKKDPRMNLEKAEENTTRIADLFAKIYESIKQLEDEICRHYPDYRSPCPSLPASPPPNHPHLRNRWLELAPQSPNHFHENCLRAARRKPYHNDIQLFPIPPQANCK